MVKEQFDNEDPQDQNQPSKKQKQFSAKEFRKQLSLGGLNALREFSEVIKNSEKHDYILEYLQTGGTCLELLQCLEMDSRIPPSLVFEIITQILLKISTSYLKYQSSAYESCRYMLNNYITVINKMINLSSTTPERKACLKLLTAMVTFSPILAKDILIHVNFHSTNVELLTKHTGEKDSVRDNFIKFLTAYLVDGHYPALSVLLEKKGFITSIISGLKFDSADTLCLVISAMKNFILESQSISKTAKMKTFNTIVIRDIVNLYNWKGPAGFRAEMKNKSSSVTIDEVSKSKVNETIYDFLLILCTNHKHGIIFKDHLVGLGKKHMNALMYTVLESLDRPWEHSYASELVIKICGACPDLTKTLWGNLKPFVEPRMSSKWITAMKFAVNLCKELQPSCIEYCIKELNEWQLFQVTQCLILPYPILKTIIPENFNFDSPSVKQYILLLLLEMLKTLRQYLNSAHQFLTVEKHTKFETSLKKHLSKNFPDAINILTDWNKSDENSPFNSFQNLEIIVDIFDHYKVIAPDLLESINNNESELTNLLLTINNGEVDENLATLQVKIISLFIDLDHSKFSINSNMFESIIQILLKIYFFNNNKLTLSVLNKLFKNTGIFDGCFYEINIWIDGILDLKNFDESVVNDIIIILRQTNKNIVKLLEKLSLVQSKASREQHYSDIIQNLIHTESFNEIKIFPIKHKYISPMVLGLLSFLSENIPSKGLKIYTNFVMTNLLHLQTNLEPVVNLVNKCELLTAHFKQYATSWVNCSEILSLNKSKGRFSIFQECSVEFLFGDLEFFFQQSDLNLYTDLQLNLLDMIIFYVTNFINNNNLSLDIVQKCEKFIKIIIDNNLNNTTILERILCNPILINNINYIQINNNTTLLVNITKYLLESNCEIDFYLNIYRKKLMDSILKVLKKPKKIQQFSIDFKTFLLIYKLSFEECYTILKTLSHEFGKYSKHNLIVDILEYSLKQFTISYQENSHLDPIDKDTILNLTKYFVYLSKNENNLIHSLSPVLYEYFNLFPHSIAHIDQHVFKAIIEVEEYNKDTIKFASFLLKHKPVYVKYIKKNLDLICEKKNVLLPLLRNLSKENELLKEIYHKILTSLTKTIQKPQKVGQHYHEYYQGLVMLIEEAMPIESCKQLWNKVQKFDSTEVFHTHLLKTICLKSFDNTTNGKEINNIIMTFVHMQINMFKKNFIPEKGIEVVKQFVNVLKEIKQKYTNIDLSNTAKNESLKLYFKFCLKYGVSKQPIFLESLNLLMNILGSFISQDDGRNVLDMLTSHSEFLEITLGEYSDTKTAILSLYLSLCKIWPEFMERNFVPLLLASYRAQLTLSDRIILVLLKMFESKPEQTDFYNFKPFLWGKAAATHYSVRVHIESALWRQPKMSDVLEILQDDLVVSTITHYSLKETLRSENENLLEVVDTKSYDLLFLLPLFSQLLAPEQQVLTYKFTRSGALSLTVIGLSSADKEVRQAACHILARFHYHVDARQTGKDNLLWIRYIEAVCKGTALLPDFKLNNFAAIYLARMALILTQPNHVMYRPLSQHLTAKSTLDFSTVPELYTFLHSSDINFKEHRNFTLELLRDGLRTEKDFSDFIRSMAFKLFSELYSSSVSDLDTKILILDVILSITKILLGVKFLCENISFLSQLYTDILIIIQNKTDHILIDKILEILVNVLRVMQDQHSNFMVFGIVKNLFLSEVYKYSGKLIFEIIFTIHSRFSFMFSVEFFNNLLLKVDDPVSNYWAKYGCEYVNIEDLDKDNKFHYFRLFVKNFVSVGL